jgi:hypothetical protein
MLPTTTGDTLVVWSNTDGDTSPPTAWELWSDNQWYGFTGTNTWNLDIALAIYPIVQNTLSTNEYKAQSILNAFPNPATGEFTIATEKYKDQPFDLIVYSSEGSVIKQITGNGLDLIMINLEHEQPGIYFIVLKIGKEIFTQKIIKR